MPVEINTKCNAICDGPNCADYHKKTVNVEWEESALSDANVPDDLFRLITLITATQQRYIFCSALCAQDWLEKSYKPAVLPEDNPNYQDKAEHGDVLPIIMVLANGEKKNFSSAASAKDYLKTAYIPPLSPREQEARDKKEAEKKATEKDNDA
jgi:hypothetical protein